MANGERAMRQGIIKSLTKPVGNDVPPEVCIIGSSKVLKTQAHQVERRMVKSRLAEIVREAEMELTEMKKWLASKVEEKQNRLSRSVFLASENSEPNFHY